MTQRIIRNYLIFSVIFGFGLSFTFGSYTLFLRSLGLSLFEINLVNFIYMGSGFLLEVLTGALADMFGRKKSVILGCAIMATGFVFYSHAVGFRSAVLAEVTIALGSAFISGAMGALAFDALKHYGYTDNFRHVSRRRLKAELLAKIAGPLAASAVVGPDLSRMWLFAAAGCACAGVFCLMSFSEPYFKSGEKKSFALLTRIMRQGVGEAINNRAVLLVIGFGVIFSVVIQALNMYWPIVFRDDFSFTARQINIAMALIQAAILCGNQLSELVVARFKNERHALILPQLVTATGMVVAASGAGFYPVILGFFAHEMSRGVFEPVKEGYIHHRVRDDGKRATIVSFQKMMSSLGMALGLIGSGAIAGHYSIKASWLLSGLIMLGAVPLFLNIKNGEESVKLTEPEFVAADEE
jgi:DHA3 family tetracycline resistance protein-like MFS transporter